MSDLLGSHGGTRVPSAVRRETGSWPCQHCGRSIAGWKDFNANGDIVDSGGGIVTDTGWSCDACLRTRLGFDGTEQIYNNLDEVLDDLPGLTKRVDALVKERKETIGTPHHVSGSMSSAIKVATRLGGNDGGDSERSISYATAVRAMIDTLENLCSVGWEEIVALVEANAEPVGAEQDNFYRWAMRCATEQVRANGARSGDPYFISRGIVPLLEQGARTLPAQWGYSPEILPGPLGFIFLERPIDVDVDASGCTYSTDDALSVRWLFWTIVDAETVGIFAGSWPDKEGTKEGATFTYLFAGLDVGETKVNGKDGKIEIDRLVGSFLEFIHQTILIAPPQTTKPESTRQHNRARKRLDRWPKVRVVALRRGKHVAEIGQEPVKNGHGERTAHEWSCQWLVRGHWRNQFYRSTNEHRPSWIAPYVKGPTDKPFRESRRLFAVVR